MPKPSLPVAARAGKLAARSQTSTARSPMAVFADTLLAGALEEDFEGLGEAEVTGLVERAFAFYSHRQPGRFSIRIENADGSGGLAERTVIDIANDDMPFLVDSTLNCLATHGLPVLAVLHPIFLAERDAKGRLTSLAPAAGTDTGRALRESFMQIHVNRIEPAERRTALEASLAAVLKDVRLAVLDWEPMQSRVRAAIAELQDRPPPIPATALAEATAFLDWLLDNHFTFLGVREYRFEGGARKGQLVAVDGSGLGILRNPDVAVMRPAAAKAVANEVREFLLKPDPLIVTKADRQTSVHRRTAMDYVGIKRYDEAGKLTGELRVLGLFTSSAYTRSTRDVPLLRRKVDEVMRISGFTPSSHSGKGLLNILENLPRDELWQTDADELAEVTLGILRLEERPKTRLFVRRDRFDRFVSALVFIPRDRFSSSTRLAVGQAIAEAYGGTVTHFEPAFGESSLVRVHYIVRRGAGAVDDEAVKGLDTRVAELVRSWDDRLGEAIGRAFLPSEASRLKDRYLGAFSAGYQDQVGHSEALHDISEIEGLAVSGGIAVEFVAPSDGAALRMKVYQFDVALPLSARLPILENMGLRALGENTFTADVAVGDGRRSVFIHDIQLEARPGLEIDVERHRAALEACFLAVWTGTAENDAFNGLVIAADLSWQNVTVLRALARFLRQGGLAYSIEYMAQALIRYPAIARLLVELVAARFDPAFAGDRDAAQATARARIETALAAVPNLDEDRIVRRLANAVEATMRTNRFAAGDPDQLPPALAFKFNSRLLDGLPAPKPFAEIFVYATDVEGIHLRGGKIARGGIRWSDRPEDYRTEVLGLAKAQNVKNAVIVPVGAKGGFVPRKLPVGGSREEVYAEGTRAYKLFVSSLLSLTDNVVDLEIAPPPGVVRHDGDDPYLVVAADKGTAAFSDTANAIAIASGFWLDDAFASGGSAGYDHKKMGITARGGWEAVKRHFREIDVDIQSTPFTVVGVGDMSGDVFGNGMLLSKQIRLVAAFDHRDIFIDPDPDPATSHAERARLFALPRSSWQDYDKGLISTGGGVFPRSLKSIPLSDEMRALSGLDGEAATPFELMSALLGASCDLIWFGGIGTYVRASAESDAEVGDRANDAIRVAARELRAKVIGEGANLGMTQRARIEFALAGGRINTDAVDNSGGVNSSDVEVNIKIALGAAEAAGTLKRPARNKLLAAMTDEVARIVLRNNYLQTLCLSMAEAVGGEELGYNARLMRTLETRGLLDRGLEFLPSDEEIAERAKAGGRLTRPELAVLMAYAKIVLFDDILASRVADEPYLGRELQRYFPAQMVDKFPAEIAGHKLRREIIATMLANSMINRGGPSFVIRLQDETGLGIGDIAAAYAMARDCFALVELNEMVDGLDAKVPGGVQLDLYLDLQKLMRRATVWFLRNVAAADGLEAVIGQYRSGIAELTRSLRTVLPADGLRRIDKRCRKLVADGVPGPVAEALCGLRYLHRGADIVQVALASGRPVPEVARALYSSGIELGIDQLIVEAMRLEASDHFDRLAVNSMIDTVTQTHRHLVGMMVSGTGGDEAWPRWKADHAAATARAATALGEILASGPLTVSRLAVAAGHLAALAK